ncbi:MAG: hypothetical protein QOI23_17, partial [Chloroflexota bacterium]|nr:hypothetical protein [Chloroflexota bacterium]
MQAAPPRDSADLHSALVGLDLRVRLLVDTFREDFAARTGDPLRGLYIRDADIDTLLAEDGAQAAERVLAIQTGPATNARLRHLAYSFELDALEQEIVLICLAPDIDLRYERLYGYLQDDVTRRRPTLDLVARLLRAGAEEGSLALRSVLGATTRLASAGLLARPTDEHGEQAAILARPLRLEDRVVEYLIGSDALDPRIGLVAELVAPDPSGQDDPQATAATIGLARLMARQNGPRGAGPVLYLQGAAGTGKRANARAACAASQRALLLVDLPALLAGSVDRTAELTFAAAAREALLQDAILCFDGFDRMLS